MVKMNEVFIGDKYDNRLVSFIDILGFKKMITEDENIANKRISFLNDTLEHVIEALSIDNKGIFSARMFSDCICISSNYTYNNLKRFLYELSYIQLFFSFEGIFIRGGLTSGMHFENDRIIYSQGLVKAYEYEQISTHPRIIIDEILVNELMEKENEDNKYIMESPDGKYFIDYLGYIIEDGLEHSQCMKSHKDSIISQVEGNIADIKILDKYRWLAQYHNFKVNELLDYHCYDEEYCQRMYEETYIDIDEVFPKFTKI